ncbi:hypothetical protein WN943_029592 [Citrus x changshan-huyou]
MLYATYLLKLVILVINLLNFVTKLRLCTVLLFVMYIFRHFWLLYQCLSKFVKRLLYLPILLEWPFYITEHMRYTHLEFMLNFFLKMQFNLPVSEVLMHDCSWLHVNRGQIMQPQL